MQIVIDIDEESYDQIMLYANEEVLPIGWRSIINGTPLPKGHGRLIDADTFKKNVCTYQQTGCGDCKHSLCCPEDAPTIIEADTESEEINEPIR